MIGGYGLTFSQKVKKWKDTESAKLRTMTLREKLGYILHYYKGWILGVLLLAMLCGYIGDAVVQGQKEVVLQGFFTNDDWNLFPADDILRDYSATLSLGKKQRIIFDDTLYVTLDGTATEYSAASNGKIIAYMATQELDFIVTTESVYEHYLGNVPMLDLKAALSPALFSRLENYLIPGTDAEGNPCFTGIDMTQSRYIAGIGADNNEEISERYVLFLPYSAPHIDMAEAFISYCFSS